MKVIHLGALIALFLAACQTNTYYKMPEVDSDEAAFCVREVIRAHQLKGPWFVNLPEKPRRRIEQETDGQVRLFGSCDAVWQDHTVYHKRTKVEGIGMFVAVDKPGSPGSEEWGKFGCAEAAAFVRIHCKTGKKMMATHYFFWLGQTNGTFRVMEAHEIIE